MPTKAVKKKKGKKNPVGRPPAYESEAKLVIAIRDYFADANEQRLMPNKAGLCVFLSISRDTYNEYKKKYPDAIKWAEDVIENAWVQRLAGPNATGSIFYLKNAFSKDYRDRTETDVTSGGEKVQGFQMIAPHDSKDPAHK